MLLLLLLSCSRCCWMPWGAAMCCCFWGLHLCRELGICMGGDAFPEPG